MKLFALQPYTGFGEELASIAKIGSTETFETGRFENGELWVSVPRRVTGHRCFVVGTVEPPEENLAQFLLLCHTLTQNGATDVQAILPYVAYSRQDRAQPGRSLASAWLGELFLACGVSAVHTLDIHSKNAAKSIALPLRPLSSAKLFAANLSYCQDPSWTLVAPDKGAITRCQALQGALDRTGDITFFEKVRSDSGVTSRLMGSTTAKALIVDDILDTGGTLIACCKGLKAAGVTEILIAVTHGLFTGTRWQELWDLGVKGIFTTDSIYPVRSADPRIRVLSCSALFAGIGLLKEATSHVEAYAS